MIEAIERQIKPAVLAVMTSVAALTGVGAGQPRNTQRTPQRAPAVQKAKVSSAQKGKDIPKNICPKLPPAIAFSIPSMPELQFSNKLSVFPIISNNVSLARYHQNHVFKVAAPYVPDIFYEKSKLPYAERQAFLHSPEKQAIMDALKKQLETKESFRQQLVTQVGPEKWRGSALMWHVLELCDEILIYGQPIVSLPSKTESLREAVDLCGMIQLGKWFDIQKAKRQEFQAIIPEGYNEKEAEYQRMYLCGLQRVYHMERDFARAVGIAPDDPINNVYCPYHTKADFARLPPQKREALLDMFMYMPENIVAAPKFSTWDLYEEYQKIQSDKTGYEYARKYGHCPKASQAYHTALQELCLEMIMYKRPLALLHAENYSLEQVMFVCNLELAKRFYERYQKGLREKGEVSDERFAVGNMEAKALINLGKKFNHPDWVQFGQEMYDEYQKRTVVKYPMNVRIVKVRRPVIKRDDEQLTQNQIGKESAASRVREQDVSTNATSRVKSNANKGMK